MARRKSDFGIRGERLLASLVAQDESLGEESNPLRQVALAACAAADRVEQLEQMARVVEPLVDGRSGPSMHPVFGEVRQQEALLARLVVALRLPDDVTGKRPQRRQVRGVQHPSKVSSLDAARQRAGA